MKLPTLPSDDPQLADAPALDAALGIQLRTPDLDRSLRFWSGFLGLPIVKTERVPLRRYFLALGEGWLALEESATPPQSPAVSMLTFAVKDLDALAALHKRLLSAGTPVSGLEDLGHAAAFRFHDPITRVQVQVAVRTRAFLPEERRGDAELAPFAAERLGKP